MQWLQRLQSNQSEDPAFDACVAATCSSVAGTVASHGLRVLQTDNMAAAIACIAHRANVNLIMRSLLASQYCKDTAGETDIQSSQKPSELIACLNVRKALTRHQHAFISWSLQG